VNATDGTSCRAGGSQAGAGAHPSGAHPSGAHPSAAHSWADLAAGAGCPESLGAVAQVDPGALSGAELIEAIVASEKALSLLAARQMGLLTEFARPGRAGDVSELVAELMDKGGQGRRPDGEIDLDTVETLVQERAASRLSYRNGQRRDSRTGTGSVAGGGRSRCRVADLADHRGFAGPQGAGFVRWLAGDRAGIGYRSDRSRSGVGDRRTDSTTEPFPARSSPGSDPADRRRPLRRQPSQPARPGGDCRGPACCGEPRAQSQA